MSKQKLDKMDWTQGVQHVLSGKRKEFDDRHICVAPAQVIKCVESHGWKHKQPAENGGMIETNGWDYDWWLEFTQGEKSFTASGSGFYGGFTFRETEE
jgi:hypothetical protein